MTNLKLNGYRFILAKYIFELSLKTYPMTIMAIERVITIKEPHEIPAHFF